MGSLLTFPGAALPLSSPWKLLLALVLLAVSRSRVVIGVLTWPKVGRHTARNKTVRQDGRNTRAWMQGCRITPGCVRI